MTVVASSAVPPHSGPYTHKRPSALMNPREVSKPTPLRITALPAVAAATVAPVAAATTAAIDTQPPMAAVSHPWSSSTISSADDSPGTLMSCTVASCPFCRIALGASPGVVLFRDSEMMVIKDHRPAAPHHYLVMPIRHMPDAKHLTAQDTAVVRQMEAVGLRVLQDQGAGLEDVRMGFHLAPFQSVSHLHLHVLAPASQMGYFSRNLSFRPDSFCFQTPERLLSRLQSA